MNLNFSKHKKSILKKLFKSLLVLSIAIYIIKCSSGLVFWDEEVKLNDGRVIVISRECRCPGNRLPACIGAREYWITVKLPEFSAKPIIWHEKLYPLILNVHEGHLYIVGVPAYELEYNLYGQPEPFYIGYRWEGGSWARIPFEKIPAEIYETNLLGANTAYEDFTYMSLQKKQGLKFNGNPTIGREFRRIHPEDRSNFRRYSESEIKRIKEEL